ncbi:sulfotransferase [Shewanella schlegeliana]|uniref:sulfotransferase n=1 Tax=Shewanella schlegeliana TaxID=190308 RepID=UPI0031FEC621
MSDAPCFCDYQELDKLFPHSKFVYLERDLSLWLPSMQMLINKMKTHLAPITGTFHPVLKRSFTHTFDLDKTDTPDASAHLEMCYLRHKQQVLNYFNGRDDLIQINISHEESLTKLLTFLGKEIEGKPQFPHLNRGRKVACWEEHTHQNKVSANSSGPLRRKFFDYNVKR